jgi:gluconolactonase
MQPLLYSLVAVLAFNGATALPSENATVSIDSTLTYCLLPEFQGNVTENFIDTSTTNATTSNLFASAKNAVFISYDQEFLDIIGPNPSLKFIEQRNYSFANEAGIWVPDKNEAWFTSSSIDESTSISVLNLNTSIVYSLNTSIPIVNANGGYYFNGKVYFVADGNATVAPSVYAVDPQDGSTTVVINNYFGLRFNGPNDMTWVKRGSKSYMFFTDDPLSYIYDGGQIPVLTDAVWRYDPQEQSLVPVTSRADIVVPNGITVNANQTKLYVTDTTPISPADAGAGVNRTAGSNAIYSFDLDEDLFPINKRLLGIARTGIPDGLHVDDYGRIWTGESEGIVVRNPRGKVIGLFNAETILADQSIPIANFALAGDVLVLLASKRLWTLKLAQNLVSPDRYWTGAYARP